MRKTMAIFCTVGLLISLGGWLHSQNEAEKKDNEPKKEILTLTEGGINKAPIIVFEKAPPMTRKAADELATYIEKISGAKPKVIEGLPNPIPEHAIWIGFQPELKKLFPKINFDFKDREEILIAANGKHLVIAGRDRWNTASMEFEKGKHGISYYGQQEYGTANAIYTFIQDYLGVRWLWPGPLGEDIIKKDKIAFAPFEYHYSPPIQLRRGILWWWDRPEQRGKLTADWGRFQRLTLDSSGNLASQCHAFGKWWDRFHETHPEYFALQPDGKRTNGYPGADKVKMCMSNPDLWDAWMVDVEKQIKEDPSREYFTAAENDNICSGHCICPKCEAWDAPNASKRIFVWDGTSNEHAALSDRQIRFANVLAAKLKEKYPDKDYKVMTYAYGFSNPAPINVKPDKNVVVVFVGHLFNDINVKDRWSLSNETFAQQISDWSATGANLVFRPNLPGDGGLYYGLPDVAFGRVMECYRFMVSKNCVGFNLAVFWNFWPTQGPMYYMLAQLAWDPKKDGYKVLDDYYKRAFGPAAEHLKAYWTLLEETRNKMIDSKMQFWDAYNAEFFKKTEGLLEEAENSVKGENDVYHKRIIHVKNGLVFTKLIVEIFELKEKYKSKNADIDKSQIAQKLQDDINKVKNMVKGDLNYCMGPDPYYLGKMLDDASIMLKRDAGKK